MCSIFHNKKHTRKPFKIHIYIYGIQLRLDITNVSWLVQIKPTAFISCNLLAVATCQCYQTATENTILLGTISPDKERTVHSMVAVSGCFILN